MFQVHYKDGCHYKGTEKVDDNNWSAHFPFFRSVPVPNPNATTPQRWEISHFSLSSSSYLCYCRMFTRSQIYHLSSINIRCGKKKVVDRTVHYLLKSVKESLYTYSSSSFFRFLSVSFLSASHFALLPVISSPLLYRQPEYSTDPGNIDKKEMAFLNTFGSVNSLLFYCEDHRPRR